MVVTTGVAEAMTDITAEVPVGTAPTARVNVDVMTVVDKVDVGMVAKAEIGITS